MAHSKLKLFLDTLKKSKFTVEPREITEDAEKELELVKSQTHSTAIEIMLKDMSSIIRLSKDRSSINQAKKLVKRLEDMMPAYEALLKKKPKKKPRSARSGRILNANTHNNDDHENTDYSHVLLERSKKAAAALANDNPDITDLSNQNRPTKIAERFSEVYGNYGTDAFDEEKIVALKPRRSVKSGSKRGFSVETQKDYCENTDDRLELLERSKKAAAALTHDNPDITDLSDPNRPTKIAERFSELYDNEWTDAFEETFRSRQMDDQEIISDLLEIVKSAYKYCTEQARKRIADKTANTVDDRNQYRKVVAQRAIPEIQTVFMKEPLSIKLDIHGPKVKAFVNTCVELCWWMCIQERPVYMCNVDDETFNRDFYRAYTKSGTQLDYIVWPALKLYKGDPLSDSGVAPQLKLYKDGPLLYRGVAQFK